jgi:hypothetical protein
MPVIEAAESTARKRRKVEVACSAVGFGQADSTSLIDSVMKAFASEDADPNVTLARLKREDSDARHHKRILARQLKNARRVNNRLKEKAKLLTNDDLVQLLLMRGKHGAPDKSVDLNAAAAGSGAAADAAESSRGSGSAEVPSTHESDSEKDGCRG